MKIICVGGTSSNCGKTAVVCMLLKALPGWAAVKVTPSRHEEVCPRGHDCSACRPPESRYEIITDTDILALEGKDTARYISCGTDKVMWVRALPEYLHEALDAAMGQISGSAGVIVESTTALQFIDGLHIMVTRTNTSSIKESACRSAQNVDIVAMNMQSNELEMPTHPQLFTEAAFLPVCAILTPEHPTNCRFVEECLRRIGVLDGSKNNAA